MRYVTVLRHCYWVRGQATPPSNHDMIDGEVGGGRFTSRLVGTRRSTRCPRWDDLSLENKPCVRNWTACVDIDVS